MDQYQSAVQGLEIPAVRETSKNQCECTVESEKGLQVFNKGLGMWWETYCNRGNSKSIGTEVKEHYTYPRIQSSSSSTTNSKRRVSFLKSYQEKKNLTISL